MNNNRILHIQVAMEAENRWHAVCKEVDWLVAEGDSFDEVRDRIKHLANRLSNADAPIEFSWGSMETP